MPSQPIQDTIAAFQQRRADRAGKPPPSLAQLRATFAAGGEQFPIPADVAVTPTKLANVPAAWLDPPEAKRDRVVLFLHGGGYQIGSLASHGELAARIGREARARVLFLDYPLAPEHPFPAAIDAALATWRALSADHPAATIALAGDSAGGGLALALMEALRDAKEPLPAAAALMSPHVDLTLSGASFTERADRDPIFAAPMIQKLVGDYLAGADPRTPRASPLFGSLAGLPPLLIQVGSEELLYSDAERLATAATAAGVEVTYDVAEGLFHVYQAVATAPEAQQATAQVGAFLRSHWR
ncbi:MAG TPA: alpha/beta hydrolase [Kofleriaceae bacterium]